MAQSGQRLQKIGEIQNEKSSSSKKEISISSPCGYHSSLPSVVPLHDPPCEAPPSPWHQMRTEFPCKLKREDNGRQVMLLLRSTKICQLHILAQPTFLCLCRPPSSPSPDTCYYILIIVYILYYLHYIYIYCHFILLSPLPIPVLVVLPIFLPTPVLPLAASAPIPAGRQNNDDHACVSLTS